jgi:phosphate:Na+ symporter
MNTVNIILGAFGGLGLFFYGFHITGKALQKNASFRFKKLIDKLTHNIFMSTMLGFLVTIVVQSSSATTVFLVNFINTGLINLASSLGVIFGANIGTTITVQIISFHVDQFVLPAIGVGVVLKLFSERQGLKTIGDIVLGFGIIFLGIILMKNAFVPLQSSGFFQEFLSTITGSGISGVLLGLVVSATMAALIHSSGATLAIVVALSATGIITDLWTAIPLILGAKIGTCVTAFLASVEANRDAKRAAMAHFIFNLTETALVLIFMPYFVELIQMTSVDVTRQIANAHTASSIITALICLPFARPFIRFLQILIPVKEDEHTHRNFFDIRLLETPSIAIDSVKQAILRMGEIAEKMLGCSCEGFTNNNFSNIKDVYKKEKEIDHLQVNIFSYVMEISKSELSGYQALVLNSYREITNDFERMADHIENIVDNTSYTKLQKLNMDTYSTEVVTKLRTYLMAQFDGVYKAFKETDPELASKILTGKKGEKDMYKAYTIEVNQRIIKGEISAENGMLLVDVIYNMQRISYHMRRVLYSILRISQKYEYEEEKLIDVDDV